MTAASFIPDAGSAERPRVLLADDHAAMLALTAEVIHKRLVTVDSGCGDVRGAASAAQQINGTPGSSTRAALITGRNRHSVGFCVATEQSTGYPGYDSIIDPQNATIGELQPYLLAVRNCDFLNSTG